MASGYGGIVGDHGASSAEPAQDRAHDARHLRIEMSNGVGRRLGDESDRPGRAVGRRRSLVCRCRSGNKLGAGGMYGHALITPDWPGARLPEFVRDLTTVAIAVISRDGILIDANRGFISLLPDSMTAED